MRWSWHRHLRPALHVPAALLPEPRRDAPRRRVRSRPRARHPGTGVRAASSSVRPTSRGSPPMSRRSTARRPGVAAHGAPIMAHSQPGSRTGLGADGGVRRRASTRKVLSPTRGHRRPGPHRGAIRGSGSTRRPLFFVRVPAAPRDRQTVVVTHYPDGTEHRSPSLLTDAELESIDDDIDAYVADAGLPPRPRGYDSFIRRPPNTGSAKRVLVCCLVGHDGGAAARCDGPVEVKGPARDALAMMYRG